MSERRLGKTGLIEHVFTNHLSDDYETFLVDIYTCKNLREMVYLLASEVFKKIAKKQSLLERLLRIVHSLKTTITYNVTTGLPELGLGLGKIQHLKKTLFIFAGSERHLLEDIFNDPRRPFYNSVTFMQLLPIEKNSYIRFCQSLFSYYGKSVSEALVSRLYTCFQGITWYLQLSMNEAFTLVERGGHVDEDSYQLILNHLVDSKRFTFEDRYASLTGKQKAVLQAIAAEYPKEQTLTSQDFILNYSLKTASSVQTAVKGLVDKGILSDRHGSKRPTDILFILWLKSY